MKAMKRPQDNKTFCANGRRFSTIDEVHTYAAERNLFVSNVETVGLFTMCDLTAYESGPVLSEADIVDLYRPA